MEAVPRRQRLFTLLFQNNRELRRKPRIPGIMAERIRDHMVFCVSDTPNIKQTNQLARTAETLARFAGSGALDIIPHCRCLDRKSVVEGKSVSVWLDLGVRRIIKKKKK